MKYIAGKTFVAGGEKISPWRLVNNAGEISLFAGGL
jgi:hypothetical protein